MGWSNDIGIINVGFGLPISGTKILVGDGMLTEESFLLYHMKRTAFKKHKNFCKI
jgi:hypothetical protein